MKKLFMAASLIFASIPGISVMTSGLGTPPGYGKMFGGVIQAFGALAILLLLASREKLKGLDGRKNELHQKRFDARMRLDRTCRSSNEATVILADRLASAHRGWYSCRR